jgi:hypothetical protein
VQGRYRQRLGIAQLDAPMAAHGAVRARVAGQGGRWVHGAGVPCYGVPAIAVSGV